MSRVLSLLSPFLSSPSTDLTTERTNERTNEGRKDCRKERRKEQDFLLREGEMSSEERMPIKSMTYVQENFDSTSQVKVNGRLERVLGRVFFENDQVEFGELLLDFFAQEGERILVQIDLEFFLDTITPWTEKIDKSHVFSLTQSITSSSTLILPGPWLIGKSRWETLVQEIQGQGNQSEQFLVNNQSSCIIRLLNRENHWIHGTLSVLIPTLLSRYTPFPLLTKDTEDGFGIVPHAQEIISVMNQIKGIETSSWNFSLSCGQSLSLRIQRNTLEQSFFFVSGNDLTDLEIRVVSGEMTYCGPKTDYSPWNDIRLSIPFAIAIETNQEVNSDLTVDFTSLG